MSDLEICSSRVKAFRELHQRIRTDYSEARIVVFSKFLKFLDIPEEALSREAKVEIFRFDGTKDLADRTRIKNQFGIAKGGATIMVTPGSGGSGLNLTAGTQLIQCEVWWGGNEEKQVRSRLYRQLQEKIVHAWCLEATNSVIDAATSDSKMLTNEQMMRPLRRRDEEPPQIPRIDKWYTGLSE